MSTSLFHAVTILTVSAAATLVGLRGDALLSRPAAAPQAEERHAPPEEPPQDPPDTSSREMPSPPRQPRPPVTRPPEPPSPPQQPTAPQPPPASSSSWIYPNSHSQSTSGNTTRFMSPDDPRTVSGWYRNRFSQERFPSVAAASSEANGNAEMKLSGAKGGERVDVLMRRGAGESQTRIELTISH